MQFQESALTTLSVCSGISIQAPHLVKCLSEVWLNFQHQWIWIKEKSNQSKEWVFLQSHNDSIFEHIILCKIQESQQMFTSISSSSIYLTIWEKLSCIAVDYMCILQISRCVQMFQSTLWLYILGPYESLIRVLISLNIKWNWKFSYTPFRLRVLWTFFSQTSLSRYIGLPSTQ